MKLTESKSIQPSMIDTKNNKEFKCMHQDAKQLFNLIDQCKPGHYWKMEDYLWPGILAGQSKLSVLEEICKSIQNHITNFNDKNEILM